jgi:hypothetical protein
MKASALLFQRRQSGKEDELRRIILRIGDGLLVIALFTAALSAQTAPATTAAAPAKAAAAAPAHLMSDGLNQELPKWLRFNGEYRSRFEGLGGLGFKPDSNDAFLLSRLRLNMKVSPTSWMRFQFQAQDAQAMWRNAKPDAPPYEDTFDLRQGYMELGNSDKPGFALRVGRQELFFGDQRLVGHLNWTNTARSFDAVRATIKFNAKYKVDGFASAVVNLKDGSYNKSSGGNDLHGVYGSIDQVIPKATFEPYAFWRLGRGTKTEAGAPGLLDRKVYGGRIVGKLPAHLDYGAEMVGQAGSVGTDTIQAWAGHWVTGYTLPKVKKATRLIAEYNYASGDKNPGDAKQQTFDQLYPTGHDKLGLSDQVGWKNIEDLRTGVEFKATKKLAMNGFYHSWWLASTKDALYNSAGTAIVSKDPTGNSGRYVGQEADIQATYTLRPELSLAGGYANVFPGTFLKNKTPGKQYRFSYVMATYSF